jgi:NAD(P)H-flavin reductase
MNFLPTEQDLNIIICGPKKMSVALIASLDALGYRQDQIFSYAS